MASTSGTPHATPPPTSPSIEAGSRRASPIHVDADDADTPTAPAAPPAPPPLSTPTVGPSKPTITFTDPPPPSSALSEPPPPPAPTSTKPVSTAHKPKSTKARPRSPSPSPPPAPPPPLQTVRLEIRLGGPDNYEVDISRLAKDSGQRAPTPVPVKRDTSDSEGEGGGEGDDEAAKGPKAPRRKKNLAGEYYDVNDPFIDDSELALDERTYFAQTKQQGFYVSSGEVALLKDQPPVKKPPKSKKGPAATVVAANGSASAAEEDPKPHTGPIKVPQLVPNAHMRATAPSHAGKPKSNTSGRSASVKVGGTKDEPITVSDQEDNKESVNAAIAAAAGLGGSASASASASASGSTATLKRKHEGLEGKMPEPSSKKRRKAMLQPFHPELEDAIADMKVAISKEDWTQKGRFPPALKPVLASVALKAVILGEYNDNFFNVMPTIFPYNKFTMTKLIKRTIFPDHLKLLQDREEELLQELATLAKDGLPRAEEEWEKLLIAAERRKAKHTDLPPAGTAEGTPNPDAPPPATQGGGEDVDMDADASGAPSATQAANGKDKEEDVQKKYRLTEHMKAIIWNLVCVSNKICSLENEKNALESSNVQVSEQGLRKGLYKKIVDAFPEGWMTSGHVSREVSVIKKKFEKEEEEVKPR